MFTNNELQKHLIEDGFFENNSEKRLDCKSEFKGLVF